MKQTSVGLKKIRHWLSSETHRLAIIFALAVINGLVFVFLVPPWQHYDEPKHFEYVGLVAGYGRLPHPGDFDPVMSRAVTESMIANNFYGEGSSDVILPPDQDVEIHGYSQLEEPPLYYTLAVLPVYFLQSAGVETQLYAARLVSFLLYLVTILAAWGIISELTPKTHPLRWMLPFSLALLPGFTDLMTAVNNDVGAIALFSLFLWGSIRIIVRGISAIDLIWTVGTAILCYFTKNTAYMALPMVLVVLTFAVLRDRWRPLAWSILGVGLLAGLIAVFSWGDAALWARQTVQEAPTRVATHLAPLGDYAFQLELDPGVKKSKAFQISQLLSLKQDQSLTGKPLTVGAWMWASEPVRARTPVISTYNGRANHYQEVELTEEPRFVAYSISLPGNMARNWLTLSPLVEPVTQTLTVFVDGVLVIEGEMPVDEIPHFDDDARTGKWGGEGFLNLVRNPSAEASWPRVRPGAEQVGKRFLPDGNTLSLVEYYLLDWQAVKDYHILIGQRLFRTFWAKFGWGHVPLTDQRFYLLLFGFAFTGVLGGLLGAWRERRRLDWGVVAVLTFVVVLVWGQAFIRSANYICHLGAIYLPVARYVYPVVIPTMLILNFGWLEIYYRLESITPIPKWFLVGGYLLGFLAFNVYSVISIIGFYYQL